MAYRFPYTNFHEINLDKFMKVLNTLKGGIANQILIKKTSNEFDFKWEMPKVTAVANTLPPGEQASANMYGPIDNQTLELGIPTGPAGPAGPAGADGVGVPAGGAANYVLAKASSANYDTVWKASESGTTNYNELSNKPQINGNVLTGNQTASQLGLITQADIPTKTSDLTNDSGFITSAPVTSVNSKTGAVNLTASDVGALPSNTPIPTKTSDLTNDSGFITSAPVTSVNSKTGAVNLTASDVGALPSNTPIPTKTSDLTNDSGFITSIPNPATVKSFQNSTTWTQNTNDYTQTITISGYTITSNSIVDLEANTALIVQMIADGINGLFIENNSGQLILHAVGGRITSPLTIQCCIMEADT